MAHRSKDWNENLALQLKDDEFVREFVLAAIQEGATIHEVLQKVVHAYGVKEFADKIGMADSNLLRSIGPNSNPTVKTLNQILKPFSLTLTLGPSSDVA